MSSIAKKTQDVIEGCTRQTNSGLLNFPEMLGKLIEVGVESYFVDYRNSEISYYLSTNQVLQVDIKVADVDIPETFNKDAIVSAIHGAQNNLVRYPEFIELTMKAGCVGYIVWIAGKHVSYYGRKGEVHNEYFPN